MKILMSLPKAEAWLEQRHAFWFDHLTDWCTANRIPATKLPSLEIAYKPSKWAGRYYSANHKCEYAIAYTMLYGESTDEVVAHEMCHAFQANVSPGCEWHGEIFRFLLKTVCGKSGNRYHNMDDTTAATIARLVNLHKKINT